MPLQDLSMYLEINIEEALQERFMDNEKLYIRFLRKLLVSQEFIKLQQAVEDSSWEEALRLAHNLKGVCANLGLVGLSRQFSKIVTMLRTDSFTVLQINNLLANVELTWNKTLTCIGGLEE